MQTEVALRTLPPGSGFYLDLYTRRLRGVLIEINRGSCTVAVESQKPARTIRTADGRESAPIKQGDRIEHWDLETPVMPTGTNKIHERFFSYIDKNGPLPENKELGICWIWNGARRCVDRGYGAFWFNGKLWLAHRVVYTLMKGDIPEGLTIDHLCKNEECVNPTHLEAVTQQVNVLRGEAPAAQNARKIYCKNGHELAEGNLVQHRLENYGRRACLICYKLKGETKMIDATAAAPAKEKKVRTPKAAKPAKVAKAAEPKKLLTTRYAVTSKAVPEKLGYDNEDKKTHNATIYRFVRDAKEPVTFAEITEGIGRKFGSESKAVENIYRWHIQDLMKKGLLKSMEKREEVEAA